MTPERWARAAELYESALAVDVAARPAFLAEACRDDSALRREVESLLAHEQAVVLLDEPVDLAAAAILGDHGAALQPNQQLGPYRIESLLGAGGMGQVYRARDTKLQRDVALKILPESFVHDPDRLGRFTREAHLLASLNHPNIGAIHGFEDSGPVHALVLELVEGPTLADRIARGPIPVDEALAIARQIAEALEAAHEHGIVHRDLKPANIKVRDDGTVKVLDFGLAKLTDANALHVSNEPNVRNDPNDPNARTLRTTSPTVLSPAMTAMGVILGTAAYMSPEQAKGKPADKRSDIWAFGCVLYEMLTGKRAFDGDDVSDTLAAVLRGQPDWTRLPSATPARVLTLLQRCLERDRSRRVADVSTAVFVLDERTLDRAADPSSVLARRPWLVIGAALVGGVAIAMAGVLVARRSSPEPTIPPLRLELTTATTSDLLSLAVSPDGRFVTYVASSNGIQHLWLRPLDSSSARPLANTDRASNPFWSPDSRAIGFFADGMLKRVDLPDGVVRTVTRASGSNRGGTWSTDGTIFFVRTNGSPILRVAADGGEPAVAVVARASEERNFPTILPDRKRVLYFLNDLNDRERNGVYVGGPNGSETRLLEADAAAVFVPPSSLLFVRQGTLFVQELDLTGLKMVGSPRAVADRVTVDSLRNQAAFAASASGVLIYRSGAPVRQPRQMVWVDRAGRELQSFPILDDGSSVPMLALAPDSQHVALTRTVNGARSVWVFGLQDGSLNRLTSSPSGVAQWSPDGARIVFRSPGLGVVIRSAFGAGTDEPLPSSVSGAPTDWSRDGRHVLLRSPTQSSGYDILAVTLGTNEVRPIERTRFDDMDGQFSPDGRWVAYQSNESGRFEIYLQEFGGRRKLQVSTDGGEQVRWRSDGKELFYVALDGRLMAVPVRGSETIDIGAATPLFPTRIGAAADGVAPQQYAVSADGQRFLMNTVADQPNTPIQVLLNWRR